MSDADRQDPHQLGPLLERARRGDRSAVNALLSQLRPYLYALVRNRLDPGSRLSTTDSDIVQESLVRLSRGFETEDTASTARFLGDSVPQLLAWIEQIVGRLVADQERHDRAQKRDRGREDPRTLADSMLASDSSPSQRSQKDEEMAGLQAALQRLPPQHRQLLELRYFQHLPFADIAEQLGKSVEAVRVAHLRALTHLRRELGERP
jgi:RNA polymerase sigma-70 factor (ECF subfamily)